MARLTSNVHVQFDHVDAETRRVLVRTDDGLLPIEAVSQGTASLMGWVGFLVQRLYGVFPDAPRPCHEPAIVLVDEIDAHMHPEWQQRLVQRLSEEFPGIQFIVTTHSPLIVAGMPVEQVFRFDRNAAGEVVPPGNPAGHDDGTCGSDSDRSSVRPEDDPGFSDRTVRGTIPGTVGANGLNP